MGVSFNFNALISVLFFLLVLFDSALSTTSPKRGQFARFDVVHDRRAHDEKFVFGDGTASKEKTTVYGTFSSYKGELPPGLSPMEIPVFSSGSIRPTQVLT